MAAVTVTTSVHFARNTTPDLDITAMGGGRWMVAVSDDCTMFGSSDQLRAVALSILDQIPAPGAVPTCHGPVDGAHTCSSCDCDTVTAGVA